METTSMPLDGTCRFCAKLRQSLSEDVNLTLGPADELFKVPCSSHGPLLRFIREEFADELFPNHVTKLNPELQGVEEEDDSDKFGDRETADEQKHDKDHKKCDQPPQQLALQGTKGLAVLLKEHQGRISDYICTMVLARRPNEEQGSLFGGRILDPEWMDMALAKKWKAECLQTHGEQCGNPWKVRHVSPAWLIDTFNECLVPGKNITDYVTLSYRWDNSVDGFRLKHHLLEIMQAPGSLSQGQLGTNIALSIRHAMKLVRALDERYLWVDAICIVHDNQQHSTEQLRLMGVFYASAKLTIVASEGDASYGIRGFRGISEPRKLSQNLFPIFGNGQVIVPQEPSEPRSSSYFSRGWTFQEFYLAKRRLEIGGNQMRWHCTTRDQQEDLILPDDNPRRIRGLALLGASIWVQGHPNWRTLSMIVREYNGRKHSYPEDALPGISGLLSMLGRSLEGGFLFGLPEVTFDAALCWHGRAFSKIEERKASGKSNLMGLSSPLPSWSWIKWRGDDMEIFEEEAFAYRRHWTTTPITQWFTHETPGAQDKRLIRSSWFQFRERSLESENELAKGWTRGLPLDPAWLPGQGPPEGLGKYVYYHESKPDHPYWLPVPLTTVDEDTELFMPPQTPYISCETRRAWFSVRKPRSWDRERMQAQLLDDDGEGCGWLHLQTREDMSQFEDLDANSFPKIELVAICLRRQLKRQRRVFYKKGDKPPEDGPEASTPVYEDFYGVLWVAWNAGVAYRKALGYIEKEVWEHHKLEDIDLVLG